MTWTPEELRALDAAYQLWYEELEEPREPHASDCARWVGERCDCVLGRALAVDNLAPQGVYS